MIDSQDIFKQLEMVNLNAQKIVETARQQNDWRTAFDLVFSTPVSRTASSLIARLNLEFDYYDPDTSYEEDVLAYTTALNTFVEEKRPFFQ